MKKRTLLLISLLLTASLLTACNQGNSQSGNVQQPSATSQGSQNTTPINQDSLQNSQPNTNSVAVDTSSYIGEDKAMQIALENAEVSQEELLFSQAKLDSDDGIWIYDVEFYAGNKEYDYEIDAVNGTILSFDYDMEGNFNPNGGQTPPSAASSNNNSTQNTNTNTAVDTSAAVSIDTARQTALSQVPGATADNIRINTDYDDGRLIYEGKIIYNNVEYDFEIDGNTGNITEWEAESIYD